MLPCRAEICCRPHFLPHVRALSLNFLVPFPHPESQNPRGSGERSSSVCGVVRGVQEGGQALTSEHPQHPVQGSQVETLSRTLHPNEILHLVPAAYRARLCYQLGLVKSLFSVCFAGTRARSPGLPWQTPCQGLSWGRASAFPWTWARPRCPQGQEELSSFPNSTFPRTPFAPKFPSVPPAAPG